MPALMNATSATRWRSERRSPSRGEPNGAASAQPESAHRPLATGVYMRQVCCTKSRWVIVNLVTIRVDGQRLQLLPGRDRPTCVRATVEVRRHLDGAVSLWHGEWELSCPPAPVDARALPGERASAGGARGPAAAALTSGRGPGRPGPAPGSARQRRPDR